MENNVSKYRMYDNNKQRERFTSKKEKEEKEDEGQELNFKFPPSEEEYGRYMDIYNCRKIDLT